MSNIGFDYSMGRANLDRTTGIHYGVISQHSITQAWCDSAEPVYDKPEDENDDEEYFAEPIGWKVDDGEYHAIDCLDSDVMVLKSPYFTHAQFCSPCVPGAGNLECPMPNGVACYCFGHDWFDEGRAPYPVYFVSNGDEVPPPAKEGEQK
jgi:hypothetical protein